MSSRAVYLIKSSWAFKISKIWQNIFFKPIVSCGTTVYNILVLYNMRDQIRGNGWHECVASGGGFAIGVAWFTTGVWFICGGPRGPRYWIPGSITNHLDRVGASIRCPHKFRGGHPPPGLPRPPSPPTTDILGESACAALLIPRVWSLLLRYMYIRTR